MLARILSFFKLAFAPLATEKRFVLLLPSATECLYYHKPFPSKESAIEHIKYMLDSGLYLEGQAFFLFDKKTNELWELVDWVWMDAYTDGTGS